MNVRVKFGRCSKLEEIVFCGSAPNEFGYESASDYNGVFFGVPKLTAYNPVNSEGWDVIIERYNEVSWVADEPSAWAKSEVGKAVNLGLVTEHTNTGYQSKITRIQFAGLVVNMVEIALGDDIIATDTATFVDIKDEAVLKAYAAGIIKGMGESEFTPGLTATREQIAVMLYRAVSVNYQNMLILTLAA